MEPSEWRQQGGDEYLKAIGHPLDGEWDGVRTFELACYIEGWIRECRPWRYSQREVYRVMTAALRVELYNIYRLVCGQPPQIDTPARDRLDRLAEEWMRKVARVDWDFTDCDRVADAVLAKRAREDGLDQLLERLTAEN